MFTNLIDILFLGFSVNLILACFLVITALNAVGALMALVFAFINATCLFFLMDLEFIGLLFLILYVGAVAVLFLFSVMLFNLKDIVRTKTTTFILTNLLLFVAISFLFLNLFQHFIFVHSIFAPEQELSNGVPSVETIFDFSTSFKVNPNFLLQDVALTTGMTPQTSLYFVGQVIYNRYCLYLILVSVILLVAMVGAVVLINNPKETGSASLLQHVTHQLSRGIRITRNF